MKNGETSKSKKIIRSLSGIVDAAVLVLLFFVALVALYALWDAHQLYAAADSTRFETYKPTESDALSYDELREMNPDVMGWLTVYDTKIDYPVLNSKRSNDEYLSRNPFGEIEAAGSLFIDHNNSKNWTDFNTIIFGHHMDARAMFGDLDLFLQEEFFNSHEYGNLFYKGKDHGIQFFSMMAIDAHAREIYSVPATTEEAKQEYLDYIRSHTKFGRDVEVSTEDRIVLLSTCSEDITNGRFVLVGKILDQGIANPYVVKKERNSGTGVDVYSWFDQALQLPVWEWIVILVILIALTYVLWRLEHDRYRRVQDKRKGKSDDE